MTLPLEGTVFHLMFQAILSRGDELAINRKFDRNSHWLREHARLNALERASKRAQNGSDAPRASVMSMIRSFVPFL